MENSDYFCVKCLIEGDEESFVTLYNKYHRKVYYSALKMTRSETSAQDITQNVFLKIWDHRAELDPDRNFAAFIGAICRNAVFDLFKKATCEETVKKEILQFADIAENEQSDDFYEEYKKLLDAAIAELPSQRRIVFERCKLREQSYDEVARSLGIARSTVHDHIVKANKFIRDYLQTHGNFSFVVLFSILMQNFNH